VHEITNCLEFGSWMAGWFIGFSGVGGGTKGETIFRYLKSLRF